MDTASLIVPSISIYEVFKWVLLQRDEREALRVVALMNQATIVDLDEGLALRAAALSCEHGLPIADAVILATARAFEAILWTQDVNFLGLEGVIFVGPNGP